MLCTIQSIYISCQLITFINYGCVSLRKSKIGFLNPKESKNGFCISLLNRSIQDLSDHGDAPWSERSWIDRFQILPDVRIQSWIFLKKCTLRKNHTLGFVALKFFTLEVAIVVMLSSFQSLLPLLSIAKILMCFVNWLMFIPCQFNWEATICSRNRRKALWIN